MQKIHNIWLKFKAWKYSKPVLVLVSYLGVVSYYMTPSVLNCTDTLYGFGDNTGGPIWRNSVSDSSPLWGKESVSNFPDGDNLYSPTNWSGSVQYTLFWLLAKVAGPICGYNLLNVIGFLSTAFLMFAFINWLIRRPYIAWLAGYAVAFSPYIQVKIGGHPSYAFTAIFIAIIWLFLLIYKKPSLKYATLLGLVSGLSFYFDPYFVLYEAIVLFVLAFVFVVSRFVLKPDKGAWVRSAKYYAISGLVAALIILPLVAIYISSKSDIEKNVSAVRGNVLWEATACSNYPHEYLLPYVLHPIPRALGIDQTYINIEKTLKNNISCGIGEDTVGISLTLLTVIGLVMVIIFWEYANKRKIKSKNKLIPLSISIAILLLIAGVLIGLPPEKIGGIPTPTKLLLDVTQTWRTLARAYLLVNMSIVILVALAMGYVANNKAIDRRIKIILFVIVFIGVFVEYQIFTPFMGNTSATFSYSKNIPSVYESLRQNSDIASIAEYPLESFGESDAPSYYLSMQYIHKKKILNSPSPTTDLEKIRRSLKNLSDPQTIPALAALGVDAVVVHGIDQEQLMKVSNLKYQGVFEQSKFKLTSHSNVVKNDNSIIIDIKNDNTESSPTLGVLEDGFFRNLGLIKNSFDWAYEAVDGAEIKIRTIHAGKISKNDSQKDFCFDIRASLLEGSGRLILVIDGDEQDYGPIENAYRSIKVSAKDGITLKSTTKQNMQITSLGCK